jgi:hypothetical protein
MIQSPGIDANPLALRHLGAVPGSARDALGIAIPSQRPDEPTALFDPEYAAFRAALLSLARDGHRLLARDAEGRPEASPLAVHDVLRRVDQLEEWAARYGVEPVQRWLQKIRRLILDKVTS